MTKSEEIAALVTEAAREGSYPTDVANLAIQKFMEWEKKHYDIYPKDTPLTMKEDPCLTDSRG
jgi:hypothetical protein|tara:strand:+ start:941 stop:1129 length:189 start_codon:yes stop_codon:yes gene_type:complete